MAASERATPVRDPLTTGVSLAVDLTAIAANYRQLSQRCPHARCAAVVKANAYGLGAAAIAPALADAGCRVFAVAHLGEGLDLRKILPEAEIWLLNGVLAGAEADAAAAGLIPVVNDLGALERWTELGKAGTPAPVVLHIDTGMCRLGLPDDELATLIAEPARLEGVRLHAIMSHLVAAEEPEQAINGQQLAAFRAALAQLPTAPASLANSSGIFLGPDYHFDLVRPGVALYGVNPRPVEANPMRPVVHLSAPILQVRAVDSPKTVGYGATHAITRPSKIATIPVGYADGYLRKLSNKGICNINGLQVPVVGRVSMDLTTIDVTDVPEPLARPGTPVELIGPDVPVDMVADAAGTIGYEILTVLGRRYRPRYLTGAGAQ